MIHCSMSRYLPTLSIVGLIAQNTVARFEQKQIRSWFRRPIYFGRYIVVDSRLILLYVEHLSRGTIVKQDQILSVNLGKCIGFWVYRGSYLLLGPP